MLKQVVPIIYLAADTYFNLKIAGLPGLKPRFYLLLYDFFGPDSMTFYDHFMTF